jgi:hypothetical protein
MTTTKIVPFHEVPIELLAQKSEKLLKDGHKPFFSPDGNFAGFVSPFSASRHVAQVQVDDESGKIVAFDFDQIERTDGAMDVKDPWGHATPNAMAVIIEETEDGSLVVHAVSEDRPFMYDHRTGVKGMKVTGITGKWAKEVGKNPAATILAGLLADTGIIVDESTVKLVGIHNPNRAWVETCNEVYVATFKRVQTRISDGTHDHVQSAGLFPLGEFPPGPDALVNSALWLTARHFGCVSSKPIK